MFVQSQQICWFYHADLPKSFIEVVRQNNENNGDLIGGRNFQTLTEVIHF